MSKEFIEKRVGSADLAEAIRQKKQLREHTVSEVQEDITISYLDEWAKREYRSNSDFLNYVKVLFRTENFLTFYKYYRKPSPASALINDVIMPALERVFYSDDSYFHYTIKGERVNTPEQLETEKFQDKIFREIILNHNSIIIHDLEGINQACRYLVDIENVVSIESHDSEIERIAFKGWVEIEEEKVYGYIYVDAYEFAFYDNQLKESEPLLVVPHDLGECPADYITPYAMGSKDVVRKGILSYSKEKLEEYDFLKTLQKLTEPSNAFPVIAKLKTTDNKAESQETADTETPLSSGLVPKPQGSPTQPGSLISIPIDGIRNDNNDINMDIVKNFFSHFYAPVEILEFINKRIDQIHNDLIVQILGDFKQKNEDARNELDVKSGYVSMEDRLRVVSKYLSRVRNISDYKFLSLENGPDQVSVDCFYGSDFFLASENELYTMFKDSPNVLERKHILKKLSSTRNKFNPERAKRDKILYDLIPFISDKDFNASIDRTDNTTFLYQTRFEYWIGMFEAQYGDIVEFWDGLKDDTITKSYQDSEIINIINNLVKNFIKDYERDNPTKTPDGDDPRNKG